MNPPIKCNYNNLLDLFSHKDVLTDSQKTQLSELIDKNDDCWRIWNKVRWDTAMNSQGVKELREYLGDDFVPYYDSSWALAREWNSKKRDTKNSIEEFYKHTFNYMYNSTIFYESGDRIDLKPYFLEVQSEFDIKSVIDYGCGVGNDGLSMIEHVDKVIFVDFDSPTLDFLRWRLKKRGISVDWYEVIGVFDDQKNHVSAEMFWSIDVIEHMKDPLEIFKYISDITKLVVYYTDDDDEAGGRHPFHFKINDDKLSRELRNRGFSQRKHSFLKIWYKTEK